MGQTTSSATGVLMRSSTRRKPVGLRRKGVTGKTKTKPHLLHQSKTTHWVKFDPLLWSRIERMTKITQMTNPNTWVRWVIRKELRTQELLEGIGNTCLRDVRE